MEYKLQFVLFGALNPWELGLPLGYIGSNAQFSMVELEIFAGFII